jgi:DNA-binding winged helix-turn-helix (wHTH) protein
LIEEHRRNAIADATLVATLKGRIRRAPPAEQDAARRAILDVALQAVYGKRLIALEESATADHRTVLRLCVGRQAAGEDVPPDYPDVPLDRERGTAPPERPDIAVDRERGTAPPERPGIALDRERGTAIVDGRVVKLTPGTMVILNALVEAGGDPVSQERLAAVQAGTPTQSGVAQQVWRLRQLLGSAGGRIQTVRGHGWALAPERPLAGSGRHQAEGASGRVTVG